MEDSEVSKVRVNCEVSQPAVLQHEPARQPACLRAGFAANADPMLISLARSHSFLVRCDRWANLQRVHDCEYMREPPSWPVCGLPSPVSGHLHPDPSHLRRLSPLKPRTVSAHDRHRRAAWHVCATSTSGEDRKPQCATVSLESSSTPQHGPARLRTLGAAPCSTYPSSKLPAPIRHRCRPFTGRNPSSRRR